MALKSRRLFLAAWPAQLTLEQCRRQFETLAEIPNRYHAVMPLVDLHALALKRQIRLLLGQSSEALRLLAYVEVQQ